METTVMGVDGCKGGWVGIRLTGGAVDALFAPTIGELARRAGEAGPLDLIAIDIPIGLPDAGLRQADVLAKGLLGQRSSSVFLTPVRAALAEADFRRAVEINRERAAGRGFSAQAFGLRQKINEVDAWVPTAGVRVVEVHPEACFATMAGRPLAHAKKTWAGAELRRGLLAEVGIGLPADLGPAGETAGVDDVLDAAAAAWTARRVLAGTARCVPDPPEVFADGLSCAIWF